MDKFFQQELFNATDRLRRYILGAGIIALSGCAAELVGPEGIQTVRVQPLPASVVLTDPQQAKSLGAQSFMQRNFGLALRQFQAAALLTPNDPEVWLGIGASADKAGHFDISAQAYAKALQLTGPTVEYYNNMGFSYILQGQLMAARRAFQNGLRIAPNNTTLRNNLSIIDRLEGRGPVGTAK